MAVLLMSDIHGNFNALKEMLGKVKNYKIDACILLGDIIDYGMHSNEIIQMLQSLKYPFICNIRGNHEKAVMEKDYVNFSSKRGRESAMYTRNTLDENSFSYINDKMAARGLLEFTYYNKRCLAVHGSIEDEYWGIVTPGQELAEYSNYDYVFSGHSHKPHFFEVYYGTNDVKRRNQKKTIFINPGSIGQPRNLNPMAQAAVLDFETEELHFFKAGYNITEEQKDFADSVDIFYKERLWYGI